MSTSPGYINNGYDNFYARSPVLVWTSSVTWVRGAVAFRSCYWWLCKPYCNCTPTASETIPRIPMAAAARRSWRELFEIASNPRLDPNSFCKKIARWCTYNRRVLCDMICFFYTWLPARPACISWDCLALNTEHRLRVFRYGGFQKLGAPKLEWCTTNFWFYSGDDFWVPNLIFGNPNIWNPWGISCHVTALNVRTPCTILICVMVKRWFINPLLGIYVPYNYAMTISHIPCFDHGTYVFPSSLYFPNSGCKV